MDNTTPMIPQKGIGNLDRNFVSKTLPKLLLKEMKAQKINIDDHEMKKQFIHDATIELSKKFKGRDKIEEEYSTRLGKVYGLFEKRQDYLSNFMETSRDSMFRMFVGESKNTKESLEKGDIKRSSLVERVITGNRFIQTNLKDVLTDIVAEKKTGVPTVPDAEPVPEVFPDVPEAGPTPKKPKKKKGAEPVVEPVPEVMAETAFPRNAKGHFLPRKHLRPPEAESTSKFFGQELESTIISELTKELEKLPDGIRQKAMLELEKLGKDTVRLDEIVAEELKNANVSLKDIAKLLGLAEKDAKEEMKRGRIEAASDQVHGPGQTGKVGKTAGAKKKGFLSSLLPSGGSLLSSMASALPAAEILAGLGALAGGLIWAAVDGILGYFKAGDWGVSKLSGVIGGVFGSTSEGMMGAFQNAGKWGLIGAGIGSVVPVIGTLVGGLVGVAIGGILGWIGGERIAQMVDGLSFEGMWKTVTETLSTTMGKMGDAIMADINEICGIVSKFFSDSWESLKTSISGIVKMIDDGVNSAVENLKQFFVNLFDFSAVLEAGTKMIAETRDYVSGMLGKFVDSIKDWFKSLVTFDWFGKKNEVAPPVVSAATDTARTPVRTDDNLAYGRLVGMSQTRDRNEDEKLRKQTGGATLGVSQQNTVNSGNRTVNNIATPIAPWNPNAIGDRYGFRH